MRYIMEEVVVDQIPILSIRNDEISKPAPAVIYLHGYGGDKEEVLDLGHLLASKGITFISFDCQDAQNRIQTQGKSKRKFNDIYPEDTGMDVYIHMHEIIEQTGIDIQRVIDFAVNELEVDFSRIGLTGFSMGAFSTFYIAANNENVKAAVPIAGKPAFSKAWDDVILSTSTYDEWKEPMLRLQNQTAERSQYIKSLDPFNQLKSFAPKPLLMINGDQDTSQIYLYSLDLYRELSPLYQDCENHLKLSMPFEGHRLSYQMKLETCGWFEKHL